MPTSKALTYCERIYYIIVLVILHAITFNMVSNNNHSGNQLANYTNKIDDFLHFNVSYLSWERSPSQKRDFQKRDSQNSEDNCTFRERLYHHQMAEIPHEFSYYDYCNDDNDHQENLTTPDGWIRIGYKNITITKYNCNSIFPTKASDSVVTGAVVLVITSSTFLIAYVMVFTICVCVLKTTVSHERFYSAAALFSHLSAYAIILLFLLINIGSSADKYTKSKSMTNAVNVQHLKYLLHTIALDFICLYILIMTLIKPTVTDLIYQCKNKEEERTAKPELQINSQ